MFAPKLHDAEVCDVLGTGYVRIHEHGQVIKDWSLFYAQPWSQCGLYVGP